LLLDKSELGLLLIFDGCVGIVVVEVIVLLNVVVVIGDVSAVKLYSPIKKP
jgi:hypothetical protein